MKSYKLVNSKEVQEKAFRLGCVWINDSQGYRTLSTSFIAIKNEIITNHNHETHLELEDYEEITIKDFLALPEPFKVGDWVKWVYKSEALIFIASEVNKDFVYSDSVCDSTEGYCIEDCIKLTPEQIKVLGLE